MQGTFRTDVELREDRRAPGALALRRRWSARVPSLLLIAAGIAFGAADLAFGRAAIGMLTCLAALGLLLLHLRAELDQWTFDRTQVVRRSLDLVALRVREARLPAREIRRIGISAEGPRSRIWLETRSGDEYALAEGSEAQVQRIAEGLARALALAGEESGRVLH